MASTPFIRQLSDNIMTAYQYPGGLPSAAVLMQRFPGVVTRELEIGKSGFTGNLLVSSKPAQKIVKPGDWILIFPDHVDAMDTKTFMHEYFDLFFK